MTNTTLKKLIFHEKYSVPLISGIIASILLYVLYKLELPIQDRSRYALMLSVIYSTATLHMSYNKSHPIPSILSWLLITIFIVALSFSDYTNNSIVFLVLIIQSILYLLWPFLQVYNETGKMSFPYKGLFYHFITNCLIVLYALFFIFVVIFMFYLWEELFQAIGIELFQNFLSIESMLLILSLPVFGIATTVARNNNKIIYALRSFLLNIGEYLLPVFCILNFAFFLFVIFGLTQTGTADLVYSKKLSWSLIVIITLGSLLVNVIFQDGERSYEYKKFLKILIRFTFLSFVLYSLVDICFLMQNIKEYGFTVNRFLASIILAILSLGSLLYFITSIKKDKGSWLSGIKNVNIFLSVLITLVLILINTSWFNPYTVSAKSQLNLLVKGKISPDEFDYGYLYFNLGDIGIEYINKLEQMPLLPQSQTIIEQIEYLRTCDNYWSWQIRSCDEID